MKFELDKVFNKLESTRFVESILISDKKESARKSSPIILRNNLLKIDGKVSVNVK